MATTQYKNSFNFESFNSFIKESNPSASVRLAIAESLVNDAVNTMARFRSPLIQKGWDVANSLAILRNANSYYLQHNKTNPATTLTVDELIKGGIALAHDKAMAKQVKAQNEDNRGRPEMTYPQHTNSGDAGKVA
jgi:hypothetical protein